MSEAAQGPSVSEENGICYVKDPDGVVIAKLSAKSDAEKSRAEYVITSIKALYQTGVKNFSPCSRQDYVEYTEIRNKKR